MRNNSSQKKFMFFTMLASMFSAKGLDEATANKRAHHQAFVNGGNPEFQPRKHVTMGYAEQNRLAKKRKKIRAKSKK